LPTRPGLKQIAVLLLLTVGAILVHGYHPYVEDAEIYVPGIKRSLHPALYPYNDGFFTSHAKRTLFPNLIAGSIRVTHLPFDWALLLWHFFSIFMLLLGCWHIGRLCFPSPRARWGGAILVGALLTIPVAGTALYIMDQYLNTRSLSTPAVLFVIINVLERRFWRAGLWAIFTAAMHPLMVVFGLSYVILLLAIDRRESWPTPAGAALLLPLGFPPVTEAYRRAINSHSYFFLLRWEWYEWLGIFGPLVLLCCLQPIARKQNLPLLALLCRALVVFGAFSFVVALVITIPSGLANLAELQPLRSLHLVYILLFIFIGGLLAEFCLKDQVWRWLLVFLPLCAGMFYAQRQLFPATPHLELPGLAPHNEWVQAFVWIRDHDPPDAYFALDPEHMRLPGEDQHGFRAIAERSMLADELKDSGAVTMFPALADRWQRQVQAESGWRNFQAGDFRRLKAEFGVDWVVLQKPARSGLDCKYENNTVAVCRID
jgi:hypothetical protein